MVTAVTFSEAGGHPLNEDSFLVQPHPLDPRVWVCFVADGQGGRSGGGRASQLACRTALAVTTALSPKTLDDGRRWAGVLRSTDEAVCTDAEAGFTTFIALCVHADRVVGISNGDSAALLVSGAHTTELTAGQSKNPPVGSGTAAGSPFAAKLIPPWRLLVMTDGVWKYAGWQRVVEAVRRQTGADVMAELQQAARLVGSGRFQDDFTVVLLESARPPAAG